MFKHANGHLLRGPLKYVIGTPDFQHWHHSADGMTLDRHYAAHYGL